MAQALLLNREWQPFNWKIFSFASSASPKLTLNKLPQITLLFWLMKICATTLGETGGDLLSMTLNVGYGVSSVIFICLFFVLIIGQMFSKRHIPALYWSVIVATSTAGTTMSDFIDRTLGLGYVIGTSLLITMLVLILSAWKRSEGSLSVDNIRTRKAELFYWTAILFSNTLGTAFGDFLADSSGLGFGGAAMLITFLLVLIILAHYFTKISGIVLFWIAFVLTRPFGATFGDLLTKTPEKGGLGFGTKGSSLILFALLVVLVIYSTVKGQKPEKPDNFSH